MGFQDRDYVKEKHKALREESLQKQRKLQDLFDRSYQKKTTMYWTYLGGILLIIVAIVKEIYF